MKALKFKNVMLVGLFAGLFFLPSQADAKMFGQDKGVILNKAINDTLARTIMTSLTVFLTLLALFIFGGEVTRGFAFAMLVGVITGCYSSIFVAAPILMDVAKDKPLGEPEKDKTLAKARHSIS